MENAAFMNLALGQILEDEEWSRCISRNTHTVHLHLRKRHQTLQGHREKVPQYWLCRARYFTGAQKHGKQIPHGKGITVGLMKSVRIKSWTCHQLFIKVKNGKSVLASTTFPKMMYIYVNIYKYTYITSDICLCNQSMYFLKLFDTFNASCHPPALKINQL